MNATLISLLPKVENPQHVTEFRPIALCNVVFKCISKILANRIKSSLEDIVDQTQNAFIPGRRISDNILLTQELFKNYHRQVGKPRCAVKVDIKKAYDSVNWNFLLEVLHRFGFPNQMVQWIRECISTPCYSIILNGQNHGFFKAKKGLRQGDPISPYLFTLVMQVLSVMIKRRIDEDGRFRYHAKCEELKITHLSFADHLFLFSLGDPWSVQILKDALDEFGAASGLWLNHEKSNVFFCKVSGDNKMLIRDILGVSEGFLPVKYLGVPLISTRLWHADCMPLIDKVRKRIGAWQNKWLSYAGRLQLAISVLGSLQVYWGSVFILPVSVSKMIEKLIRNFIWGGVDLAQGKAKVSWKDVCVPKMEGGLGIKPLLIWNQALMAYHVWSVVSNRQSLWVKWIHTYRLRGKSFWEVKIPWDASWSWRRILNLRAAFRPYIKTLVGDGTTTFFWHDYWILNGPLGTSVSAREIISMGSSMEAKVADCVVEGQWVWPQGVLNKFNELREIPVTILGNRSDRVVWRNRSGVHSDFRTGVVWQDIRTRHSRVDWWHLVWYSSSIPKHSFILWLAIRKKLMTQDRMQLWQSGDELRCVFCELQKDSVEHLFFDCKFTKEVMHMLRNHELIFKDSQSWQDLLRRVTASCRGKSISSIVNRLFIGAMVYVVWQERNWRLFQNKRRSTRQVSKIIEETIRMKLMGLRFRDNSRVREVLREWDIQESNLQSNYSRNGD